MRLLSFILFYFSNFLCVHMCSVFEGPLFSCGLFVFFFFLIFFHCIYDFFKCYYGELCFSSFFVHFLYGLMIMMFILL
jgi:hypothetical protein